MRVLATGAAGFIGSHALRYFHLLRPSWEFVVLDRLNYASTLDRIGWARGDSRVKFLLHDIRAPIPDWTRDQIGDVDYVLHFAAETHVDRSMVDPRPFVESNVLGTLNLLEFCRLQQPRLKMFFMVSTDEVYGPAPFGVDHTEEFPHRPSNPYSAAKAGAEDLAYAWSHSMGVPVVITCTMNNVAEAQHPEKFVPMIIRRLRRGEVITVHGSPDAPGSRKYLYAPDHADAISHLMENGKRGERYNVVGQEEISNLDMVRRLERIMHREAKIKWVDFHLGRPGHDRRYSLDGSKLAALGWTPPTPIDEALQRMVEFTAVHPAWA